MGKKEKMKMKENVEDDDGRAELGFQLVDLGGGED